MLTELISKYLEAEHGTAVCEQFEKTFEQEEEFDDQNYNALTYIKTSVSRLRRAELFKDEYNEEIDDYLDNLESYLNE